MWSVVRLAWVMSVRQPGRTSLGVLGVAAVGALLFDMLLLSRGLVLSFRDLLDRAGFDVRVMATDAGPPAGPPLADEAAVMASIAALPQVEAVVPLSIRDVELVPQTTPDRQGARRGPTPVAGGDVPQADKPGRLQFIGTDPVARPMWTLLEGGDLPPTSTSLRPLIVNRMVAETFGAPVGAPLQMRGGCGGRFDALPPVAFTVVGIAAFPFDDLTSMTLAGRLSDLGRLCGSEQDAGVDMLLVMARPPGGADAAAAAIRAARPGLYVVTNEELVERFGRVEFSYFRQMAFVLATVTLFFGALLIAALLTASVNQRLGEIAALRAVGLSRTRVVAGVLCESAMLIGAGAVVAIPVGAVLSVWLDHILRAMPGIPAGVHFFVFEMRVLIAYTGLLAAASVGAALYPMRIVARLPIAATLRREVVG